MFKVTRLQRRPKYDIFQKALFCYTLASSTYLRLNTAVIAAGAVFMKRFYFFLLKIDRFWSSNTFSKKCKLKRNFLDNLRKSFRLFHVLAQFISTISEMELDYCHQKVSVSVASRVALKLRR